MFFKVCFIFCFTLVLILTTRWCRTDVLSDEEKLMTNSKIESVWTKNLPYETWMNIMIMGVKVGRFHICADRAEYKGQNVLRINLDMFAEIKRFGLTMKTTKTKLCYIRDDLSPCYFLSRSDESGQEKIVEGSVENGVAIIKTTLEGKTTEKKRDLPDDVIFTETMEEMFVRKGFSLSDKFSLSTFSLEFFDTIEVKVSVLGKDKIEYKGQVKDVFVVEYVMDIMGGIVTKQWIAPDGEVYKMEMPSMYMSSVKVDEEEAMSSVGQIDLLINTKVSLTGEPPSPGIRKFKVKSTLPEGDILATFVNDHRQKVSISDNPNEGIIEVTVEDVDEQNASSRPINNSELLPYQSPSIYIQSDDPEIILKAQEIAGDEKNSWKAAMRICEWVNKSIKNKNYKVGFGTAKQTLKDLQGDCSEHTVLFIGLARALGIPSRICTGLVYNKDAFYYHFWPEVYVGQWVSMEPTLGQAQADAAHVRFSSSPIETESLLELGEGVLRTMNRLRIERIE